MADASPFQLGEMVVKTVPAFTGLTAAARLTIPGIPIFAERATTDLMRVADARGIAIVDAPVFVYTGAPGSGAEGTFLLQIAMPVAADRAFEGTGEIEMVSFRGLQCVAVEYVGPMMHIGDAYPLVVEHVRGMGHKMVEQSREVYRRWVGYDSVENVVEIQLGIAGGTAE